MPSNFTLYANRRIRVVPNRCVYIKKIIEKGGVITVSRGTEIQPHNVIGKTIRSAGYASIDLAKKLGVSPKNGLMHLSRPIGKTIYAGELLAQKKGLFGKKVITAPTDALIESYNDQAGVLRLRYLPKEVPVPSGVFGIVEEVNPQAGEVLIKTLVTQIVGILGSGKERSGLLNIASQPGQMINASQVTTEQNGQILVAGSLIFGQALKNAFRNGVKGIITGGLNLEDYRSISGDTYPMVQFQGDVGMSVVVTEGFGPLSIGNDIFEIIKPYHGRFVIIHGNLRQILLPSNNPDSILMLRKTSLPVNTSVAVDENIGLINVVVGSRVRIIHPPYMGSQGVIEAVDATPTVTPSGVSSYLVTVDTKSQKLKVPYLNLEVIS